MKKFIKVVQRLEPPKGDARTLAFIMKNQDQDLLVHISFPPPYVDPERLPNQGSYVGNAHGGYN